MPSASPNFAVSLKMYTKGGEAAAAKAFLEGPSGPVVRDLLRRGRAVESKAKQLCPVDKGRLRSTIHSQLVPNSGTPAVRVGTNVKYAVWVHDGTGIFGPRGKPITPVKGRYLVFTPRGAKGPVFAKSVRGMKGRPFLKNALPAANS